mgnify:FL=1
MKYIITEGQNDKIIIRYLNSEYGDLEEYRTDKYPKSVFYVKDKKVYMEMGLGDYLLWVDHYSIWEDLINIFSLDDEEIERIITKCVEERYNIYGIPPLGAPSWITNLWKKLFN